jgi:hypothetical protein
MNITLLELAELAKTIGAILEQHGKTKKTLTL